MHVPLHESDWLECMCRLIEGNKERERDTGSEASEETVIECVVTADTEVVTEPWQRWIGTCVGEL